MGPPHAARNPTTGKPGYSWASYRFPTGRSPSLIRVLSSFVTGMSIEQRLRTAAGTIAASRAHLESEIRVAVAAGWSLRRVAALTDISHESVRRIVVGR